MPAAISTLGRLVVAENANFTTNPVRLNFGEFEPGVEIEFADMNLTRGKLYKDDALVRTNRVLVLPRVRCQPNATELAAILKWATSGTPTGSPDVTYPFADVPLAWHMWYRPNEGTGWRLEEVAVDTLTIRGSSGQPLDIDLELVGRSYTHTSTGFPNTPNSLTTSPLLFKDLTLTVGTTQVTTREFTLTVRHNIDRERFLNSERLTALNKLHTEIMWMVSPPAGDFVGLWDQARTAGVSCLAEFNGAGTMRLRLRSPAVRFRPRSPNAPFRSELFLSWEGEAYSDNGTNDPLEISLRP